MSERPQVLYRFYGFASELLYVGISVHAPSRFMQHREDKPWWTQVAEIRLEHHPDRATVRAAEVAAIREERPAHNVQHAVRVEQPAAHVADLEVQAAAAGAMFRVGDVVALDVVGITTPPVGQVEECDDRRVTLAMFSWLSGYFGFDVRSYPLADIRAMLPARLMTESDKREGGYLHVRGDLWDMDPLADFQNAHRRAPRDEMP